MPWCPNCKSEYRAGFTVCPQCGVYLHDRLPPQDEQFVLLASFSDAQQKAVTVDVLRQAQIPTYCKDRGPGSYVRIMTGSSVFGEDLYVPISCQKAALALLAQLPTETDAHCDAAELDDAYEQYMRTHEAPPETDEPVSPNGYRVLWWFLGIFLAVALLVLLTRLV